MRTGLHDVAREAGASKRLGLSEQTSHTHRRSYLFAVKMDALGELVYSRVFAPSDPGGTSRFNAVVVGDGGAAIFASEIQRVPDDPCTIFMRPPEHDV